MCVYVRACVYVCACLGRKVHLKILEEIEYEFEGDVETYFV